MKILFAALFAIVMALPAAVSAQGIKLGHINYQEMVAAMPEVARAKTAIDSFSLPLQQQMKALETEYQNKLADYQANMGKWPDAIRKQKETELMALQQSILDFQQDAQKDVDKKREELLGPVMTKVENAIKAVAKENGYTYVFDTSAGILLYHADSQDITALVKKKLNLP